MTIELIKEGKNGQMEIDFESLEAITSKELVRFIKIHSDESELLKCKVDASSKYVIYIEMLYFYRGVTMYLSINFSKESLKYEYYFTGLSKLQGILDWAGEKK